MVLKMAELYSFSVVGIKVTKRVTTLWQLWGTCSTSLKLLVLLCFLGNLCEIPCQSLSPNDLSLLQSHSSVCGYIQRSKGISHKFYPQRCTVK